MMTQEKLALHYPPMVRARTIPMSVSPGVRFRLEAIPMREVESGLLSPTVWMTGCPG
jgi:hypothetical protein